MNHTFIVGIVQGVQDIEKVFQQSRWRTFFIGLLPCVMGLARRFEQFFQGLAHHELHGISQALICGFFEGIDRHHIGMFQLRGDLHFFQKAREHTAIHRHLVVQLFIRDFAQ